MTARPLWADDFAITSPLSARHWRIVGRDGMLLEARDELDRRRQIYPGMVTNGTLTQAGADRAVAIWRAIVADLDGPAEAWDAAFTWEEKVREIRRELAMRRNAYPKWIAKPTNPLTERDAIRRCERLDAIHARYWLQLEHWPVDRPLDMLAWIAAREQRECGVTWEATIAAAHADPLDTTAAAAADAAQLDRRRWAAIERAAAIGTTADVAPMLAFVEAAGDALCAALTHETVDDCHHRPSTLWLAAYVVRRLQGSTPERIAA